MFIERLHLKGFKSFGSATELLFSPGLTAIVGPNGSGKSNLLDALRWVLGDGSAQRLRIARQGDLLFSGSPSLPPASRAEVTLSLRKDDREASPRCLLKRFYSAESGTVLTVDGLRMRLADLDGVKRLWHLEGDQFAFIGQGEIADTIHHRPSQRRAHLEVLFGIDQYRKKRTESLVRLTAAGEENRRLDALLAELTHRRDEIAPAAVTARKARGLTDELREKRGTAYFYRRFLLESERTGLGEELALLEEKEERKARWKELWEKTGARSLSQRGALEEKIGRAREEREELVTRRSSLQRSCFAAASSVREIRARLGSLSKEGEDLAGKIRLREEESGKILRREEELSGEHRSLQDECCALRKTLEEHLAFLEEERIRRKKRLDRLSCLAAEKETLASRLQSKEAVEENCGADLSSALRTIESLGKKDESLKEKLAATEEGEGMVRERHGVCLAGCRTTASLVQQGKKEKTALERSLEDLKNTESSLFPEPVRVLVSASRLGKIPFPVLTSAEAFSCPEEFTLALESWLGGRQYWVLVHTVSEAGRCIDMLKERRAGRATFLPLERSSPRSPIRTFSLPSSGVAGWAADVVVPLDEWRSAVAHLLGDLLIVNSYAVGAEIIRRGGSFPVVTLEGDVFAPSGTVSGGKSRSAAGGAIERRQRIAAAAREIADRDESLRLLSLRLGKEEEEERKLSSEKEGIALQVREIRADLERNRRELALAFDRKIRLEKELVSARQDILSLKERVHAIAAEMEGLHEEGRPAEGIPHEKMAADLAQKENLLAVAAERLLGQRALRERAEEELEGERQRLTLLQKERDRILGREEEEKKRLFLWGKEQGRIFSSLKEKERMLQLLLEREKKFLSRSGRIAFRTRRATEEAGAVRETLAALSSRKNALDGEIDRLAQLWEEDYPYRRENVPDAREGSASESAVRRLERELKALEPVEWGALSEEEALSKRIGFLTGQFDDVKAAVRELQAIVEETDRQVAELFSGALENINSRFNALFQRLFGGGEARLQLEAASEPGSAAQDMEEENDDVSPAWDRGVEIVARPPGKHLQNLAQLSGGEQSLTAIAHLFASMEVAGVPLAVLDEVDAALDESNLLRFGELAKEYADGRGIQLLVMTHRRATMERADILYGVTLAEPGLSKVLGIRMSDWVEPSPELSGGRRR